MYLNNINQTTMLNVELKRTHEKVKQKQFMQIK